MSVSVYVDAHRRVSEANLEYLKVYNSLVSMEMDPPDELVKYLREVLGNDSRFPDEEITIPLGTETVSVSVRGEGDAKYGDGMIIEIANLPPGTEALRIYME